MTPRPDHPDGVHWTITPDVAEQIWDLFVNQGISINHIVFLLDSKHRIDDVSEVIRAKIRDLRQSAWEKI